MNRSAFLAALRRAEAGHLSRASACERLDQLRQSLVEPWCDARMHARAKRVADRGEQPLPALRLVPLATGESWLLTAVGPLGDAVRIATSEDDIRGLPRHQLARAVRALAAAATGAQQYLPREALTMRVAVCGDPDLEVGGSSLHLAACVAIVSKLTGVAASSTVAGSAAVDDDGRLQPITCLAAKCAALREQWPQVDTVVVATAQTELPVVEGLRFIHAPDLATALRHFGLDLAALPTASTELLRARLGELEDAERQIQANQAWPVLSAEAWALGEQLLARRDRERGVRAKLAAGLMASHAGDATRAAQLLGDIAEQDIKTPRLRARRLVCLASATIENDVQQAIAIATDALSAVQQLEEHDQEDLGRAFGTLGRARMHGGDWAAAQPLLRRGHEEHADEPGEAARSACYLACCLRMMGDLDRAHATADDAVEQAELAAATSEAAKPTVRFARLERGRALLGLGRHLDAIGDLEAVCAPPAVEQSYPRLGAHRSLAAAWRAAGNDSEARNQLLVCLRAATGNGAVTFRRAGAAALGEELLSAEADGRATLLPRGDLEEAWRGCFRDLAAESTLRTWIY